MPITSIVDPTPAHASLNLVSSGGVAAYVSNQMSALIDGAPGALDTLNELAAALNDDANLYNTLTTSIGAKLNTADFTSMFSVTSDLTTPDQYTYLH